MVCPGAISVYLIRDTGVSGDFVSVGAVAIITNDMSGRVCRSEEGKKVEGIQISPQVVTKYNDCLERMIAVRGT